MVMVLGLGLGLETSGRVNVVLGMIKKERTTNEEN